MSVYILFEKFCLVKFTGFLKSLLFIVAGIIPNIVFQVKFFSDMKSMKEQYIFDVLTGKKKASLLEGFSLFVMKFEGEKKKELEPV